jgi:hypothetical protein
MRLSERQSKATHTKYKLRASLRWVSFRSLPTNLTIRPNAKNYEYNKGAGEHPPIDTDESKMRGRPKNETRKNRLLLHHLLRTFLPKRLRAGPARKVGTS